ncbi:MAG: KamA family radical SAM protein [Simkaniaceae bacterium]|nr:KamA family radical SAM protein [Simkaniaceae bacterium]
MLPLLKTIKWREIQRNNFTKWDKLQTFLELKNCEIPDVKFPLNIPFRLAQKMQKGILDDPILKQFLPSKEELLLDPQFTIDPIGDLKSVRSEKLLHKYHGRALLLCTSACAMHCRYCFRQNFPYETRILDYSKELKIIAKDRSIKEIILSGGDPLSLSDERLKNLILSLDAIKHLKILRFHTRFPIGIPERISETFLTLLQNLRLQVVFVIHTNHKNELDSDIFGALKAVQRLGVPVLSQTVLLKGINDNLRALTELFEALIRNGIIPYYLHKLDRVWGATHFEVPKEKGSQLIKNLRATLPGYAVPRYVEEIAGEKSKTIIK